MMVAIGIGVLLSGFGFGAALAIHIAVGYIDLFHLFPVYTGIVWVAIALSISRRWFFTRL